MARFDNRGIITAKKTVALWFCGTGERRFLPLSGQALAVGQAEERAILAAAEPFIAARAEKLNGQLALGTIAIVALPVLHIFFAKSLLGGLAPSTGTTALAGFTVGGLLMLLAAWQYEKAVLDLRESIALALRERAASGPVPLEVPGARGLDIRLLGKAAFVLGGLILLWPLASSLWPDKGVGFSQGAWPVEAAAGLIGGVLMGILAFSALWALKLRRVSAAAEDGALGRRSDGLG